MCGQLLDGCDADAGATGAREVVLSWSTTPRAVPHRIGTRWGLRWLAVPK